MASSSNRDVNLTISAKDRASAELDTIRKSLDEQRASLRLLSEEQKRVNADLKAAETAYKSAGTQAERLGDQIARSEARVQAAGDKYASLSTKLSAAVAPSARLADTTERARVAYEKQLAILASLQGKLTATTAAQTAASEAMAAQRARITASTEALTAQRAKVQELGAEYSTLRASVTAKNAALATSTSQMALAGGVAGQLKGEVLSLVLAFGGLFGAVQQVGGVVKAFMSMEAAKSRLNAAFDGNGDLGAAKLDMLRRTAERLGFQFGGLANEYSKFVVAAKGTVLEGEKADKVFISMAEAARVNKLSTEQLERIYYALSQTIGKGRITSEEWVQQVGDHLPGAFRVLADAMGISGAELSKQLKAGTVGIENLVKVSDELNRRFGQALPASLATFTTQLGQFQNATYQAQLTVADSGLIDGLRTTLEEITRFLKSSNGEQILKNIGSALGGVLEALAVIPKYFREIVVVGGTYVGLQIASTIASGSTAFGRLAQSIVQAATGYRVLTTAAVEAATAQAAVTSTAAAGATGLRALFSGLGTGALGVALAAGGAAAAYFMTQATSATAALNKHRALIDEIKDAYDGAKDKSKGFAEIVKNVSASQVIANFERQANELRSQSDNFASSAKNLISNSQFLGSPVSSGIFRGIEALVERLKSGQLEIDDFKQRIDDLGRTTADAGLQKLVVQLQDMADALRPQVAATKESAAAVQLLGEKGADTDEILKRLKIGVGAIGDVAKTTAQAIEAANVAIDKMRENIPGLAEAVALRAKLAEIEQTAKSALENPALPDGDKARVEAEKQLALAATDYKERLRSVLADGVAPIAIDLLTQDFAKRLSAWIASLPEDVRNAIKITSGYKSYGEQAAAHAADPKQPMAGFSASEKGQSATVAGATLGQEQMEAAAKLGLVIIDNEIRLGEEVAKTAIERRSAYEKELAAEKEKADLFGMSLADQYVLNGLKKAGLDTTSEEGRALAAQLRTTFDITQAHKVDKVARREVRDLEGQLNDFYQARQKYLQGINALRDVGDTKSLETAEVLKGELAKLDRDFLKFMDQIEARAKALGNPKLIASIAEFRAKIADNNAELFKAKQVNDAFVNSAMTGFDTISKSIADFAIAGGSMAKVFKSARDAFLQFASDFLREIAKMILQQALLNALKNVDFGGGVAGLMSGLFHSGGIVGQGGTARLAAPEWFLNAPRMHSGGMVGLASGEVPAILQTGEEVLSRTNPRNSLNGGGGTSIQIVNTIDPNDVLSRAASSTPGQKTILNVLSSNKSAARAALGFK